MVEDVTTKCSELTVGWAGRGPPPSALAGGMSPVWLVLVWSVQYAETVAGVFWDTVTPMVATVVCPVVQIPVVLVYENWLMVTDVFEITHCPASSKLELKPI